MSDFYYSIADYYDEIFPTHETKVDFVISKLRHGGGPVVDIGCATGGLATALHSRGFPVTGIDLDPKMIRLAKNRADATGTAVQFLIGDMTKLSDLDLPLPLNGIICLGNTLVHLPHQQVRQFLIWAEQALEPEGHLICQILNYDRIIRHDIRELPIIENEHIKFERQYAKDAEERLRFSTQLTIKSTGESIKNEIPLYPLKYQPLLQLMREAGFDQLNSFGSMQGAPFELERSFPLVMVATKKSAQPI